MQMRLVLAAVAAVAACAAEAKVATGTPFADNMVLQRGRSVPVWGVADPGEQVTVTFAGQTKTAKADAQGAWRVDLDAMPASKENRVMTVKGAANAEAFKNVLVGEVWFASGQSNMECPIWGSNPRYRDGKGGIMTQMTRRPFIRYAKNSRVWSATPKTDWKAVWRDYSPESFRAPNGYLSACAFYYALELYGALDIPIGIVDSSWGGTNIDAWTPRAGYANHPELKDVADYPVTANWDKSMRKGPIGGAQQQPTVLWNGMVAGFAPYAIKGFIWYQGCHNTGEPFRYCDKMHALYDGWAKEFENPDLKLYFVQLAPYAANWFNLQQAQSQFAAEEKNASLVVTCDSGNLADIHPNDKEIVAKRLALHALKQDYGFADIVDQSPTLKSWKVAEGGKFVLTFNDATSWYVYNADRSPAQGFEIAGPDGKFVPAQVVNKMVGGGTYEGGAELVVAAKGVTTPKRLRYLAEKPWTGALYAFNSGLPLGPFEIDARVPGENRRGPAVKMDAALAIPELAGYRKVLQANLPAGGGFKNAGYSFDETAKAGAYSRVAYVLELENRDGSVDWAMASMDAFTDEAARLGVPAVLNTFYQQKVAKLTVRSNQKTVTEVTDFDGGCIEFFNVNYGTQKGLPDVGGSADVYDFNDVAHPAKDGKPGYGSMQVHNWKGGETVLAYNCFNGGCDVGLGNCPGKNPDWTFASNGGQYRARRLTVLVK